MINCCCTCNVSKSTQWHYCFVQVSGVQLLASYIPMQAAQPWYEAKDI